jgi:hypothetical protein
MAILIVIPVAVAVLEDDRDDNGDEHTGGDRADNHQISDVHERACPDLAG